MIEAEISHVFCRECPWIDGALMIAFCTRSHEVVLDIGKPWVETMGFVCFDETVDGKP